MISFRDIDVRRRGQPVLTDISFTAEPGVITALIGHNGGGKSTLLKAAAGLIAPSAGEIVRDGGIAFMPQGSGDGLSLTMRQTVLLGRLHRLGIRLPPEDVAACDAMMARCGIADLAERRLDQVSGGQRQLAFLAQTLLREPRILLLDEPTSALDIGNQLAILDLVAAETTARGLTTVIAIHDVATAARIASRIAVLAEGRLAAFGTPDEVLTRRMFAEVYGIDAHMCATEHGPPALHVAGRISPPVPPAARRPSS